MEESNSIGIKIVILFDVIVSIMVGIKCISFKRSFISANTHNIRHILCSLLHYEHKEVRHRLDSYRCTQPIVHMGSKRSHYRP